MKNLYRHTSVVFLLITFLSGVISAPVDINTAKKLAENFYQEKYQEMKGERIQAQMQYVDFPDTKGMQEVMFFVFNEKKGGYIIVSADDRLYPVQAVSFENCFDTDNMAPALIAWLENINENVRYVRSQKNTSSAYYDDWNYYLNYNPALLYNGLNNTKIVSPLLSCKWNQDSPYNSACPAHSSGPGGHCYAGCVSIAMAQIMYYYNAPVSGTGSHTYQHPHFGPLTANFGNTIYDYANMANTATGYSTAAISELIYHCGVSVDMYYRPDGSSASSSTAYQSFMQYFNFVSCADYISKYMWAPEDWDSVLMENLDLGRPLYYSGSGSSGGHAFVCDGYMGAEHYHFNWGWGGYNDGFFYLDNIEFSYGQQAIVNLIPYGHPFCQGLRTLTSSSRAFDDGSGTSYYSHNSDCQWLISPEDTGQIYLNFYYFNTEAGVDKLKIYDGNSNQSPLLAELSGSSVSSTIVSTGNEMFLEFKTDSANNNFGWQAVYNTIPLGCAHSEIQNILVYPNPATNVVYIELEKNFENTNIFVRDVRGKLLQAIEAKNKSNRISLKALPKGIYIISIERDNQIVHKKVILQ